ncbi:hypothetical protein [Clostridium saudiense]|uniref:hypothetical protein n=1 Tax=Clostridium saudiense TaxID=1414720 RepID=UPI0018AA40E0|nr:hypothetical protein [Clostridium saudiense]
MTIYLNEVVNIHEVALNLTDTETSLLYNIIYNITSDSHKFDENINDIIIDGDVFFYKYPSIMFRFMTVLLDLKII